MTINVPLLRKTMEHIEAHPEEWEQGRWRRRVQRPTFCGTAYCFAGTAAKLNGAEWRNPPPPEGADDYGCQNHMIVTPDGVRPVDVYARKILGLDSAQAFRLFEEFNTLDDLRRIVGELIEDAEAAP